MSNKHLLSSLLSCWSLSSRRKLALATVAAASVLAACGGDGEATGYERIIVFGDSLSDVGTYATPGVQSLGGGKFTINGAESKIWVELLATRAGVTAPCAAQTGLESSGSFAGLAAPITDVDGCYGYAQGGARITNPVGPYNKALLALGDPGGALGHLTSPVTAQLQRHLSKRGGFGSAELVTVLAGANDVFMNLATLQGTIGAGGDPNVAAASAVTAMATAGTELANLVRADMLPRGARRVVVVTVPDITKTPYGSTLDAATTALVQQMVQAFNDKLVEGLQSASGVLLVDAYGSSQTIAAAPQNYGIANNAVPACDAVLSPLGSLSCSAATTLQGVDVSGYQFADSVHPTPLGHKVFGDVIIKRMESFGWL